MEDIKIVRAKQAYDTLCSTLDNRNWIYDRDDEKLIVSLSVSGDDIPMRILCVIDAERQIVRVLSPLPFKMSSEKLVEGAVAVCVATQGMVDGSFEYDLSDGEIVFKMTESFRASVLGEKLFEYLIDCSCAMVDKYNDLFLALDKGIIDLAGFIAKSNE